MNRREAVTTIGLGTLIIGTGFNPPACGVSKEKAVRVTGFVIDITKEAMPLLELLGARDLAEMVRTKAIPALEKLRDALRDTDIPTSQSTLATVRSVLSGIATALLNLPDSPRRTTIIGILASVNVLLLTIEAFINSETPEAAARAVALPTFDPAMNADRIRKVFEASRP